MHKFEEGVMAILRFLSFYLFFLSHFSMASEGLESPVHLLKINLNYLYNTEESLSNETITRCSNPECLQSELTVESFELDCKSNRPRLIKVIKNIDVEKEKEHYFQMYKIFRLFNMAIGSDRKKLLDPAIQDPLSSANEEIIKKYALTSYGHQSIMKVIDFNKEWIDKGYFQVRSNLGNCKDIEEVFTGYLSEEGEFSEEATGRFLIFGKNEVRGFRAQLANIRLGNIELPKKFPSGHQEIDELALIHHEFCHTKFYNTHDTSTIEEESRIVRECENPIRRLNGYVERNVYYDYKINKTINVYNKIIYDGMWHWDQDLQKMVQDDEWAN